MTLNWQSERPDAEGWWFWRDPHEERSFLWKAYRINREPNGTWHCSDNGWLMGYPENGQWARICCEPNKRED